MEWYGTLKVWGLENNKLWENEHCCFEYEALELIKMYPHEYDGFSFHRETRKIETAYRR